MITRAVCDKREGKNDFSSVDVRKVVAGLDSSITGLIDRPRTRLRSCMEVYVRDIEATKQFYAFAFGVALQNVVIAGTEAAATLNLYRGQSTIRWIQKEESLGQADTKAEPIEGMSLKIEVEDICCMVARAWDVGAVTIEGEEFETSHRHVVCMRDPDGLKIELSKTKIFANKIVLPTK